MPRKKPRLSDRDERIERTVGLIGGVITGALVSIIVICAINKGVPWHNKLLGFTVSAIPGGAIGAVLGWLYPPIFVFLFDLILGIFS